MFDVGVHATVREVDSALPVTQHKLALEANTQMTKTTNETSQFKKRIV